jgi:hypothetical protein
MTEKKISQNSVCHLSTSLRKYLKVLPEIRNIQVGHVVVQISVSDKGELAEGVCVVPNARRQRMINFVIISVNPPWFQCGSGHGILGLC